MGVARAEAVTGRGDETLREADAAVAETRARDALDLTTMLPEFRLDCRARFAGSQ